MEAIERMPRPVAPRRGDLCEFGARLFKQPATDRARSRRQLEAHRVEFVGGARTLRQAFRGHEVARVAERTNRDGGEQRRRRDVGGVAPSEAQHADMQRDSPHARALSTQKSLEIIKKLRRTFVPIGGPLLEQSRDDHLEVATETAIDAANCGGNLVANHHRCVCQRSQREVVRKFAAQRLVEHHADRIEIAARIDHLRARNLLRRHVRQRAHHRAFCSLRRAAGRVAVAGACKLQHHRECAQRIKRGIGALRHARHAEIENLRTTIRGDEDVARLEIAVDDSAHV